MGRETTAGKENPRGVLKGTEYPLILALRQRQAPDDYIALQVTNPRISVCKSPNDPFLYLFYFSTGGCL